ncbi:hypothetical protein P0Y43_13400 [Pseudomonas entomophila]|uniref:hypothetical protein n=1 Tax=Pseudomonas entomophila TaxID=312306 RepID=UPI0023D87312|nr:hypothetical protein [Pseudomonas entomophila]MDF0731707.1 hypothetical protein [Pseudomonas entomophila]
MPSVDVFSCTRRDDASIDRVAIRVREGGHPVRPDLARSRNARALGLLPKAIAASRHAYIFDHPGERAVRLMSTKSSHSL